MSPPTAAASGLAALFSLSQAAASAQPIPIQNKNDASQMKASGGGAHSATKHRRLSSIGQTRRRLSDARDAANRPAPASLHSAASAFASLSLSTSASPSSTMHMPVGLNTASLVAPTTAASALTTARAVPIPIRSSPRSDALAKSVPTHLGSSDQDIDVDVDDDDDDKDVVSHKGKPTKGGGKGTGKKRGTIFRCESCSKVYRHPSCLVKHRWEHSPHWRESSKFLLSKHQQVQLLEAAAILTHLAPGTSLPEDRSLWPYYLSGGLLPPPSTATTALTVTGTTASSTPIPTTTATANATATPTPSSLYTVIPTSSSVPAQSTMAFKTRTRSGSVAASVSSAGAGLGPRLHDYKLPGGGITQIRPGLLGHPTPAGGVAALAATEQTSSSVVGHEDEDEDGDDVDREDDGHGEGGDEGEARDTPSPDMADLAIKATSPMPVPTHLNGYGPSRGSATFEAYRDHHHHHHNPHHHTAGGVMRLMWMLMLALGEIWMWMWMVRWRRWGMRLGGGGACGGMGMMRGIL
ncbi:hypothetical protein BD410DRAFT_453196 [Rickenella mellea]|uniref:C2H2-type domain-containing protein n=1 Tax=Rickenella mellea TaxID=50990 RepID=A0A4Y7PUB5_9AGAM|nr:hypothetical protein BD410DRAFT_453196 [Rickenella mellea]